MFLKTVRSKYPHAKIVMLTGPMLGEKESSKQRTVLDRICADANKLIRIFTVSISVSRKEI